MLPLEILIALPAPFLLALILHTTYYLLPLLHLLPRPTPLLLRLTALIPNPRRRTRNLPREFFNLPPRAGSPNGSISSINSLSMGSVLSVRGKVMLLIAGQATISLMAGWIYLGKGLTGRIGGLCLALSIIPLPCGITTITLFSAIRRPQHIARHELSLSRSAIFGSGGITHTTIIPRILPYSSMATTLICGIAFALPSAGVYLLVVTGLLSAASVVLAISSLQTQTTQRRGMIRLVSPSPDIQGIRGDKFNDDPIRYYKDSESMISSPSRPPTPHSAFSYSPSLQTPLSSSTHQTPKSDGLSEYDTPKTSLTEFTATPSTVPSWDFQRSPTPTLPSPSSAVTRARSTSPALPDIATSRSVPRGSATTTAGHSMYTIGLSSTPGSAISPGGSILAGYSPDPFHPMPRSFESLTAFTNASQYISQTSLAEHQNLPRSGYTFVPSQTSSGGISRESTWTLESYHSLAYQTPKGQVKGRGGSDDPRRAPPPPPLPYPMPLPPTPILARSETPWDRSSCGGLGKDSTELLMGGERDREWDLIDLSDEGEGLESWGSGGRGVGALSLAGMLICIALSAPLLAIGLTQTTQILYLTSLLLPSILLLISTYLLRPRPLPTLTLPRNLKKSSKASKASTSTHQSLALKSESQLSLPCTISPKLTPPGRHGPNVPLAEKWHSLLEPKPSISSFGYQDLTLSEKKGHRRHTVYGRLDARDVAAEEDMRKTLARRSVDIWLDAGHAKPAGNILERAAEMIKPHPALRVLDGSPREPAGEGMMRRLRGGVVSMLLMPKRFSQHVGEEQVEMATPRRRGISRYADMEDEEDEEPQSPITIHITSPSKFEKRQSGLSRPYSTAETSEGGCDEVDGEVGGEANGSIQMATRARMSASPTYYFGKERMGGEYGEEQELDWLQSAIIPQLMSGDKFHRGSHHISPSEQFADAETPRRDRRHYTSLRRSSVGPNDVLRIRDSSSNPITPPGTINLTEQKSPINRRELRHKHSFSLPLIDKASFSDLRSQVRQVGKDRQHNWSIYADGFEYEYNQKIIDFSAPPAILAGSGVDLPAFPVDFSRAQLSDTLHSHLSTVNELNESRMSDTTRSLAHLTLSAEGVWNSPSYSYAHTSPSSHIQPTPSSHRERLSTDSHLVGQDSFVSDDSAMAREMEQVFAMDTPTRAEFVISPTLSEGTTVSARTSWSRLSGRPVSRASSTGSGWQGVLNSKVSASTIASRRSATSAISFTDDDHTGHTFGVDVPPPVPELPASIRRPISQHFAHPFPVHNAASSIPLPDSIIQTTSNQTSMTQYRPQAPHPSMQIIASRRSAETIGSSTSTTESTPPVRRNPEWRISRQELKLVKDLQERKAAADAAAAEEAGRVVKEVAAIETRARILALAKGTPPSPEKRKGLKTLRLVANRPASVLGPRSTLPEGKVTRKSDEWVDENAGSGMVKERVSAGPVSVVTEKKVSRGGSRTKENMLPTPAKKGGKLSKGSTGPVATAAGLRA